MLLHLRRLPARPLLFSARRAHCSNTDNEYLAQYKRAMRDLDLLGYNDDNADLTALKPFFDAVVLPLRRSYAWGVPTSE